jgi:hypothetical protein
MDDSTQKAAAADVHASNADVAAEDEVRKKKPARKKRKALPGDDGGGHEAPAKKSKKPKKKKVQRFQVPVLSWHWWHFIRSCLNCSHYISCL